MKVKKMPISYSIFYSLFYIGIRLFYRKYKRTGIKNIPKSEPVFFVSNHQNSLMDPVGLTVSMPFVSYSLGRADVFSHPISGPILRSVNSLPIFRKKDGRDFKESNKKTFNTCYDILGDDGKIMIFPEGSHNLKKRLRPIKTGVSVIIDGAIEKYPDIDINIVPVGLNYSNSVNKNADYLVNYGKPIKLSHFNKLVGKERTSAVMDAIENGIKSLIIDFSEEEFYNLYHYLCFDSQFVKQNLSLIEQLAKRKKKTEGITLYVLNNPSEANEMLSLVEFNTTYCKENEVKPSLFNKVNYHLLMNYVVLLIGFPLFLYGAINSYMPFIIPSFINKKMKDKQFYGPVNVLVGTISALIFWTIQTIIVAVFTEHYIWILYLVSLPILGQLAFNYLIFWKQIKGKIKYNKLSKLADANFTKANANHNKLKELFDKF
jgi:1-acyl-sn-glycerol-3-phosphate acyltransferase